ncbi:MAG: hypothetical protein AB4042_05300 [Leptolyngbyaceae cyanobacterium]
MNRLPRRSPRQQPPLRGRLAATPASIPAQTRSIVSTAPPTAPQRQRRRVPPVPEIPTDLAKRYQGLAELYGRSPGRFRVLDRPWKWIALVVVIILMLSTLSRLS